MSLIEHISKNSNLAFINGQDGKSYVLNQILFDFNELNTETNSLALLYLDNSIQSVAIYLSLLKTNYTLVLLNSSLDGVLKSNLDKEYKPTLIFDQSREAIEGYCPVKVTSPSFENHLFENKSYEVKIHNNIKILLSTSGTTGSPKLVKLSDKNLFENAKSICDYLPINKNDTTPLNLPLHYSYGLSVLHSNAISGGKIVCGTSDVLSKDFWVQLEQFGFTSLAGVPYIYEMLNRIGFLKKVYPTLKYLTQAGGNLGQKVKGLFLDYCNANTIDFFVMYGQTEATARISYVPPSELGQKIKSIGKPIKNGSLYLNSTTQELIYSGPNIYGGYAQNKIDLTSWKDIKELHTGDIGKKDDDGYYYVIGRLKRFVKIYGNRVNLDEIESFIKTETEIGFVACTGVNDQFILVSHHKQEVEEQEIKKKIFSRFKIHPSSIKLQYLEEFPLTGNGKVDYKKLETDFVY